ncbi:MAG: peptide-methionine (S)-S-oxide reductase [Candidatus Levybacteria bacterium RIFOXYA1_FULL_41_10]|nr:MAG: Peptide methionine sulfoxide reductase [Candidatus Levybacteria bacterium GW2011_GWA2_36_13]KKR17827.1 MAG: Peptide methionine sulfoxide reductase [Candidatus Levybacteria bacterium GW2011_GWA1_39_32]KKR51562.1 MAG: Peptide methionine sulfoxide reductase [Candidatus Levybacteria bacterium GW2011_GWC1_40_19]KKR73275.1 MAG: Peptide methionine sulfoxide reductase [Candidatus Levybacteria bacterium GW2011_GWC2_40_7]KKS02259.1 MAG: Peptide methionine sulfoxide reductase [Candidatus Levybacte
MPEFQEATFGGGCFWCTEAVFRRLMGVLSVKSGYSGGDIDEPSYEAVSEGSTGHAEAVYITFDPTVISYDTLLQVFWATHDPTTLNRQGNDVGTQYRSVIFYHTPKQKEEAEKSKTEHQKEFKDKIVTDILPFEKFYTAEEHHQNYYDRNQSYPYCSAIIAPKVQKLLDKFGDKVKEEYKK